MRKTVMVMLAIMLVAGAWSSANAWTLNFENGLGNDGGVIASGIPGLQFSTTGGQDWIYGDITTGGYNTSSNNGTGSGQYWMEDNVFAWLGVSQGSGRIDFLNQDGSFFSTGYCAASNFYLEAYDAGGNLIDSDQGGENLRYGANDAGGMGFLSVSSGSANIAYVLMHDTGNFWEVDHMSGDATGVPDQTGAVPEPATLLLFGLGLVGGAIRKRMAK
jgi:hypothetical protein